MVASQDDIRAIYTKHIKSVVCVDDEFPTFQDMLAEEPSANQIDSALPSQFADPDTNPFSSSEIMQHSNSTPLSSSNGHILINRERVHKIVSSCHQNGYLVDVQKDFNPNHSALLNKADLLILDYEISNAPQKTLGALQELAQHSEYNLVIIYTNSNIHSVALQVACCLSGAKAQNTHKVDSDSSTKQLVKDHLAELFQKSEAAFQTIDALNSLDKDVFKAAYYDAVVENCSGIQPVDGRIESCNLIDTASSPWIACHNIFITFLKKEPEKLHIDAFINYLCNSLYASHPTPMSLMMHCAVSDLKSNINCMINNLMPDKNTRAVALFASTQKHIPYCDASLQDYVFEHLMQSMFYNTQQALSDETKRLFNILFNNIKYNYNTVSGILGLEKCSPMSDADFYKWLNKFICCESLKGEYISTGSIFHITEGEDKQYYLCVTPECDLERGNVRNVSAIKLTTTAPSPSSLKKLNKNKFILFEDDSGILCGEIEPLGVRITDFYCISNKLSNYNIVLRRPKATTESAQRLPEISFSDVSASVVARLRPEYAHRFMALAGAWRSRIGLDFIQMP